jgi:hypothetical protein
LDRLFLDANVIFSATFQPSSTLRSLWSLTDDETEAPDLPAKDRPIFRAARASAATHLLTSDRRHFGSYFGQKFSGVTIMLPADYLRSRQSATESTAPS